MDLSLWAPFYCIITMIALLGVLFGRMSFTTKIAVYRFNERAISTIAIGLTFFIVYALLRATVLSALGVSDEYIASENILPELALVIALLGWSGWKAHCFIRSNNINVRFNGLVPKIWISPR